MSNIVKVSTAIGYSTGIILSSEESGGKESYIVLVNRHLVDNLIEVTDFAEKKNIEINKYFKIDVYNENGILIPRENIRICDLFYSNKVCISEDIMAFLIFIKGEKLKTECLISKEYSDDLEVFTEGFPAVLVNDSVSNVISLCGKIKTHILNFSEMGRYVVEDYHYYERLSDLKIFMGLSGAPVKRKIQGQEHLLGMNVSLPYQTNGENPFKLVNFIKIHSILNYLRESGVIIYEISEKNELYIKWTKGKVLEQTKDISKINNDNDEKTVLVLGGSGAGKSSFIRSFALHGDKIDSSGDGQTTRSKVKYNFSIYQPFGVEIKLLNRDEFVEQRIRDIAFDLISFVFEQKYGLHELDIYKDKLIYFKALYRRVNQLDEKIKNTELMDDLIYNIADNYDYDIENSDNKIIEQYNDILKKIKEFKLFDGSEYADEIEEFVGILMRKDGLFDVLEFDYILKLNDSIDSIEDISEGESETKNIVFSIIKYYCKKNINNLPSEEKKFVSAIIEEIAGGELEKDECKIKKFYRSLHDILNKGVEVYFKTLGVKNELGVYKIRYDSEKMEERENLLSESLKVINENNEKKSISSLIKVIKIKDSVSNEYVKIFDDMNIKKINFIDTRGLDHIEKGVAKESVIQKIFSDEKEEYEKEHNGVKNEDGIDAVLYLKKLDSGKPNELSEVIPLIYRVSPQISLYTVFTGIDIFYADLHNCIIDWNNYDSRLPKSVEYLKSDEFRLLLNKILLARDNRKKIIYNVLCKNIIAFCGNGTSSNRFLDSNKNNIKKMLKSIIMRENISIDFIDKETVDKKISRAKVEKLIKALFKAAKLDDFGRTNASSTCFNYVTGTKYLQNSYDFGYYGYYGDNENRLDLCFGNAYNKVFSQGSSEIEEFLKDWTANEDKIESILINMKNMFLGTSISLYKIWQEEFNSEHTIDRKFIYFIQKLYDDTRNSNDFVFNPFNIKDNYFFNRFLNYIDTISYCGLEIDTIKDKFKDCIRNEKNILDEKVKKINSNTIKKDLVVQLYKKITYTSRRKLETFKRDLEKEMSILADIIFDKDEEMTKNEMKLNIKYFLLESAVYYSNNEGIVDYSHASYNSAIENDLFRYFDQESKIISYSVLALKEKVTELKKAYIKYCFDFQNRLNENPIVKDELVDFFIEIFMEEIKNDREKCLKNIYYTDSDIRNSLKLTKTAIDNLFKPDYIDEHSNHEDTFNSDFIDILEFFVEKLK
ncbi:hypothetical protein acsn021_24620 [Anaerocolumna cellulosilytica]|uniref:Uncharacterized protein n=1 Tax=Anaerocolumna cellulosilytica TaxID=433286 RepID=A0A6S6QUB1_9FIRM|nr:hypothetical protein [Anaerocolumna cellulosilytica]MBB5193891.1 hypothetical protein [Anaerocolumna cellulosilytica]BCJ94893.1 hypothetical protein acsn021_24620 [Anaerocolumna cellulosilytica]